MSEQEKSQAFSQYHSMSTEELQEILRKHAHHELEPEPDTEELFEIMQILSERRKNADTPVFRSNEEAFIDFCQYYWPREKDPRHKSGGLKQTFKVVAAVLAIVLVLAIGTTLTAKALNIDIWGNFVYWTDDLFVFTGPSSPRDNSVDETSELNTLHVVLESMNFPEGLAPTWIPDGFAHHQILTSSTGGREQVAAVYQKTKDTSIHINIHRDYVDIQGIYMKDDQPVEIYEVNGVQYFIFTNGATQSAVYVVGEYTCSIGASVTREELIAIINSI